MKRSMAYLVSLLMLGSFVGCQSQKLPAPELLEPVGVQMDSATAQIGDICNISVYHGEVVPYVEELSFIEDGMLGEFNVTTGDLVQEGQVLATLDIEAVNDQIKALETEMEQAARLGEFSDRKLNAELEIAKIELEVLQKSQDVSKNELRAKEIQIQQLETELAQTQELRQLELQNQTRKLAELNRKLSNAEIIAPFSGRIVYLSSAEKGSRMESYSTVICIADENRLHISSEYISEQIVNAADKVYAKVADKEYAISYVPLDMNEYVSLVLSGETMKTSFTVDEEIPDITTGQYVAIMLLDSYKTDVLVIPSNTLYRDEKGYYVYKIVDNQRIRQDVTVGVTSEIEVEIVEGLQEGDVVYVKE